MELNYFQPDRPNQLISEGPMEFDSAALKSKTDTLVFNTGHAFIYWGK